MTIAEISFPTNIYFGSGARWKSASHLKGLGFKRPLLVTDEGVAALDIFKEYKSHLIQSGLQPMAFHKISGNPVGEQVISGTEDFHAHDADSIIGFGGGAALDVAKAIVVMARHPGHLFDYEDETPGSKPIDREIPYWIAIPTTAGTGSEVGRSTVISDDRTHVKKIIFSTRLLAKTVFADPELTLGLPAHITAATGMDALTHCIEAFLATGYNPFCDSIALGGFKLAARSLSTAVHEPSNISARSDMLMASMMGAVAFQKGLGLTHSCAHALSTMHGLHHGLANGVMIDHALVHNLETSSERLKQLALLAGAGPEPDALIDWLRCLKITIGIPSSLQYLSLIRSSIENLSQLAVLDGCHRSNPRVCTADDFKMIFSAAVE